MKERPILFSGPMVKALRAGTKTQTRRIIKSQPSDHHWQFFPTYKLSNIVLPCANNGGTVFVTWTHTANGNFDIEDNRPLCPYGKPGDRLWVKETWRPQDGMTMAEQDRSEIEYRADGDRPKEPTDCHWKPSIFMPRWASRITLEIVSVRVERLQEISEADAIAEGIDPLTDHGYKHYGREGAPFQPSMTARGSYMTLWESINGAGSWALNPWIWVVEFRRL